MSSALKRKSYFVDERAIRRAKRVLGVQTDAEVVRIAVDRVTEMERFWRFMQSARKKLKRGSFERPWVGDGLRRHRRERLHRFLGAGRLRGS